MYLDHYGPLKVVNRNKETFELTFTGFSGWFK